MKKILVLSFVLLVAGVAPHAFAQGFVPLAPIPDLTQGVTANTAGLATFFNNLYKYAIGLAATLAVIMIIWGGLEISTQDSVSKQGAGRERITEAIIGLILVLSPVLVFSIINPSILNLSLSLPELKTTTFIPSETITTPPDSTNGTIPFKDRTVDAPVVGYWCSRDTGSGRYLCSDTQDNCLAARNKNALLITEPCRLAK